MHPAFRRAVTLYLNELVFTKIGLSLLLKARGPPESPLQVPLPPAPLVQMLVACTQGPYTAKHSSLEMTSRLTELTRWVTAMLASENECSKLL